MSLETIGPNIESGPLNANFAVLQSLARDKNWIINGNFDVWQRGTQFISVGNSKIFHADHWSHDSSSITVDLNISRQLISSGLIPGAKYCLNHSFTAAASGTGVNTYDRFIQCIEHGPRYLAGAGKKITVSFWARGTANKKLGLYLEQVYGTGGSPSAGDGINGRFFTLTTEWVKYTHTFTTATLAGKTFGTNEDDYFGLQFWNAWGSNFQALVGDTASEGIGTSGYVEIAQVQVCTDDVVLPFQPRSFADELALCQRYYEKSYDYGTLPAAATAVGAIGTISVSTTNLTGFRFKDIKRTTNPTVTIYSPSGTLQKVWGDLDSDVSSGASANNIGDSGFRYVGLLGAGLTVGVIHSYHYVCDAEL